MLRRLAAFFATGPDRPLVDLDAAALRRTYERRRWSVFLSVTIGYGIFYVCRNNLGIVKAPILDAGVLGVRELGWMGSAFFYVYAVGKLTNGFLADRCNIRRFMSTALLLSAAINLALGFSSLFLVFLGMWLLNGWVQSVGSAPSVVALSNWFSRRERGTRYGIWSASHSIGEGLTFVGTSVVVGAWGWRWGFWGPGLLCMAAAFVMYRTLADRPQTYGLPPPGQYRGEPAEPPAAVGAQQLGVLRHPAVWILGLASACMYISRYAITSWGPLYLKEAKGYSIEMAGVVLAFFPAAEILGSVSSGWVSDRLFGSRRHVPAVLYGLVSVAALFGLRAVPPGNTVLDAAALAAFGFGIGGQLVFLGGLMAVDLVGQRAAGAAMGLVGVFSYFGAGTQELVSSRLLEPTKRAVDGLTVHSFDGAFTVWLAASAMSVLLVFFIWGARPRTGAHPATTEPPARSSA
jgi:OPA family sugar phosphate sensor protein UhpC-like MFS transporter